GAGGRRARHLLDPHRGPDGRLRADRRGLLARRLGRREGNLAASLPCGAGAPKSRRNPCASLRPCASSSSEPSSGGGEAACRGAARRARRPEPSSFMDPMASSLVPLLAGLELSPKLDLLRLEYLDIERLAVESLDVKRKYGDNARRGSEGGGSHRQVPE